MHIRRFDRDYSRRRFLAGLGAAGSAGVLAPLWSTMARSGEINEAYPDELLSVDEYTKGKVSTGDTIDASNVEHVRDLLDEIKYKQIRDMGRKLKVGPTTTDMMRLSPWEYQEATLRNQGKAQFDDRGNVVTADGKPWIGGNPFPDAKTGVELFAALTLSWGRHDASLYAIKEYDIGAEGDLEYAYDLVWAEMAPVARVSMNPRPYWRDHMDKLRFQSVIFTAPNDIAGTSFLNIWDYDQHEFPELVGYLPEFKRVREYPTNQRFEPLVPGGTLFLSDAWAAGDPMYTWGNYKIVDRGPMLTGISEGWNPDHPNWEHNTHGGAKGQTFWDTTVELVPEAIAVEAEPTSYSRAPVGKKRVWFDARTGLPIAMNSYDRKGNVWRSFDGAYAIYDDGNGRRVMDGEHPYWSWAHVHCYDIQTGRMSRLEQVREVGAGHHMQVNTDSMYDDYLTRNALRRFG
ncbi:DUF1329 domain-containing protein [Salinisphaera sp. P385]|uniref:DUF1329 domain-containing protein n=1 Tax=Spectribacter acetivorans TaxID=3075603 RepID=A0ABU3B4S7_9GAMM|nr:DUF1329 domain-containing protein [Salinisphaera sp. P385]MDT0617130.1 DUF1329 domain-containing protein [Salinisphaera sp. P385]